MKPGDLVTPHLKLARILGKGGMGSVWVAEHLALGTQVAIKFMSPDLSDKPGFVERFHREAKSAAQIKSPHVVQVFDHGVTDDGTPYIVMELLEGEDLKDRIQRLGPLPLAEVALIVSQAAKALERAHKLGIVHRDIKPDNLFLMDVGGEVFVKILDFGIAKQTLEGEQGVTSTGAMLGTPLYMSPEQLLSAKYVDSRADLWSLAATAYYALTGQVPFNGDTLGALSVAIHEGVFPPPSTFREDLPPEVDAWVAKALARDPVNRFQSAREMAEALAQAAGTSVRFSTIPPPPELAATAVAPTSTRSLAPEAMAETEVAQGETGLGVETSRAPEERKRSRPLVLLALVGAALLGGGAVFFALKGMPEEPAATSEDAGTEADAEALAEALTEAGAEAVTEAGAGAEAEAEADAVTDAVTDAGAKAVTDAGADAGAVTDAGAGAEAVTDARADAGAGADAGADAGKARVTRPVVRPRPQPVEEEDEPSGPAPPVPHVPTSNPDLSLHKCTVVLPDGTRKEVPCN